MKRVATGIMAASLIYGFFGSGVHGSMLGVGGMGYALGAGLFIYGHVKARRTDMS